MKTEIDLVIIGDIAFEKDVTQFGTKISRGGSGYYSSVGASKFNSKIGIISCVGDDFDLTILKKRSIDVQGIEVRKGEKTAQFTVFHHENESRDFEAVQGTAENPPKTALNEIYSRSNHIHLSTSLPQRYLKWIQAIKSDSRINASISVDAFELYCEKYPEETIQALRQANLIFMNEEELRILNKNGYSNFDTPTIVKYGSKGAEYKHGDIGIPVLPPFSKVVDTTGAGDILAGAFLAQQVRGIPVEESLEKAVELATFSVSEFGVDHV